MSKKQATKGIRELALDLIYSVEKNQSYSNLLLNNVINKNHLSSADSRLLTEITYGTIQRKLTLDYFLQPFVKNSAKLEDWVIILLRLSLYQMYYLDKIPDHATIFEAVEIAKRRGHKGISSMVNGVLRNVQRKGVPSLDLIENPIERISIETSHPLWLVERWVKQYGLEKTKDMCVSNLHAPQQTARINSRKTTRSEVLEVLEAEGFAVKVSDTIPDGIVCLQGNLAHSQAFKNGLLTIQDESSMLVAYALGAEQGDKVLDSCAAPGGKTTSIAEKLGDGTIVALDLHQHKVKLIDQQATRLGLTNITTMAYDARKVQEKFAEESFDKVLVDAPCSGLGVMRRKPDVKYTKSATDIERLATIQKDILQATAPLVKQGGTLVYSTCTVDQEENNEVVNQFLQQNPQFTRDTEFKNRLPEKVRPFVEENCLQLFPQDLESDGFFIACFRKKESK